MPAVSHLRRWIGALLAIALGTPAIAAPIGHYPSAGEDDGVQGRANLEFALKRIPTAGGVNALERMHRCRFHIQWNVSFVAREVMPNPTFGTKTGDLIIDVIFDQPGAGDVGRDTLARWFVKSGRLEAGSGWAQRIQSDAGPISMKGLPAC